MANNVTYNLVPIIGKADLDDEAEQFLKKYYPEALQTPMAVPITSIAEQSMKLRLLTHHLSEDLSIFGQMVFTKGVVEIYDKAEDEYRMIEVDSGTMIIDPDTFFERNIGCVHNTIAHECFHWHRHRQYYFLQNILSKKRGVASRCSVHANDETYKQAWTDEDWMEWQANNIAPRILMPRETFRQKAYTLYGENKEHNHDKKSQLIIIQSTIEGLSEFFKVSKISATIRLKELKVSF